MIQILPAILAKTSGDYLKKLKAIENLVDEAQIDIVDNKFARNQTIKVDTISSIRTRLQFEIQLMVEYLEDWIDPFIKIKPKRIVVPLEAARDPLAVINHLRSHRIEVGFSINPETSVEKMQHLVDKIDVALVLAVHPGFSGQHFVYGSLAKISRLKDMRPDLAIEVDGSVEPGIARRVAQAGATILASGSFIFENERVGGETYHERVRNAYEALVADVEGVIPASAA